MTLLHDRYKELAIFPTNLPFDLFIAYVEAFCDVTDHARFSSFIANNWTMYVRHDIPPDSFIVSLSPFPN